MPSMILMLTVVMFEKVMELVLLDDFLRDVTEMHADEFGLFERSVEVEISNVHSHETSTDIGHGYYGPETDVQDRESNPGPTKRSCCKVRGSHPGPTQNTIMQDQGFEPWIYKKDCAYERAHDRQYDCAYDHKN